MEPRLRAFVPQRSLNGGAHRESFPNDPLGEAIVVTFP